jgi:Asp-tRNA(Asn)/Glu-tRNA(Gln) amidotransferase A subunit family amidase
LIQQKKAESMELEGLTITEVAPKIKSRDVSPVELTRRFLDRIDRLNPMLNAYVTVIADDALKSAKTAEHEITQGRHRGPLHGIPFSIKDIIISEPARATTVSKLSLLISPRFWCRHRTISWHKECGA